MKSDLSRPTFNSPRHYTRLLFQQGRPPLDADFNEQSEIQLAMLRTYARDIIGEHGAAGADAFKLTPDRAALDAEKRLLMDLKIGKGRYYVDGILCENDNLGCTLKVPFFPQLPPVEPLKDALAVPLLAYLDVWEHCRTWIDDGVIVDPALGGVDTAARSRVVWQVRLLFETQMTDGEKALLEKPKAEDIEWKRALETREQNRGLLRVRIKPGSHNDDCCKAHAELRYRGVENQLYRVEIHHNGAALPASVDPGGKDQEAFKKALVDVATFKWSRENGSVAAKWLAPGDCDSNGGGALRIAGPRDQAHGFAPGHWVEITDETRELRGEPGVFVRVARVEGDVLKFEPGGDALPDWKTCLHPKIRRWDQQENDEALFHKGAVVIREKQRTSNADEPVWIALENGIEIQFAAKDGAVQNYRTGDYWLIPVRVATGDVLWPWNDPSPDGTGSPGNAPRLPDGVEHHYAPLAILGDLAAAAETKKSFIDLRRSFDPFAKPIV